MARIIKFSKKNLIYSQGAEAAPPLGTVLGNIGVNTSNFCTTFNTYTKGLPNYFLLYVHINIYDNRSFTFTTGLSSIGYIINLLKFEKTIRVRVFDRLQNKIITCVRFYSILQLAIFKYRLLNHRILRMIKGSLSTMNIVVVRDNVNTELENVSNEQIATNNVTS